MTDEERNILFDEIAADYIAALVTKGIFADEVAAWRGTICKGFHTLPEHLCRDHLRSDLQRFQNWLTHDLQELAPVN